MGCMGFSVVVTTFCTIWTFILNLIHEICCHKRIAIAIVLCEQLLTGISVKRLELWSSEIDSQQKFWSTWVCIWCCYQHHCRFWLWYLVTNYCLYQSKIIWLFYTNLRPVILAYFNSEKWTFPRPLDSHVQVHVYNQLQIHKFGRRGQETRTLQGRFQCWSFYGPFPVLYRYNKLKKAGILQYFWNRTMSPSNRKVFLEQGDAQATGKCFWNKTMYQVTGKYFGSRNQMHKSSCQGFPASTSYSRNPLENTQQSAVTGEG